ncbi:MAG TPA: DUF3618 domain-containing protein [Gaiellaceae bacterium]|nr:DUF3618 domain-containing protein [Gaiellaceae bacterium]
MGQDPSVIRAEIEETRGRVGDEVDALSYKTDVGARMDDYVEEKKDAVKSKFTGAKDTVAGAVPDRGTIKRSAGEVRSTAERNPVGLVIGGVAAGFIIGTLIPQTRVENEQMGDVSDRLMDAAKSTAGEAMERGKEVAAEAASAAVETAKESGREQSEELSSTLRERTQDQPGTLG